MHSDNELSARLEQARDAKRVADDKARAEREASERYVALWDAVRDGLAPPPKVTAIIGLARAIPERHPDGANAVQRLVDEYVSDSAEVPPNFQQEHRLSILSAKLGFCRALLEAAKPSPDESAIIGFVAQALATYENLDTDDVREDLHSLRKADVKAESPKPVQPHEPVGRATKPVAASQVGVSRPKLAQAAVIAHFSAHPNSEPTAEEIGKTVGVDGGTVRNTSAWKLHMRGKKKQAEQTNADIGDVDADLESLTGTQERGRDRRNLRRRV